jgi:hypothetical protein
MYRRRAFMPECIPCGVTLPYESELKRHMTTRGHRRRAAQEPTRLFVAHDEVVAPPEDAAACLRNDIHAMMDEHLRAGRCPHVRGYASMMVAAMGPGATLEALVLLRYALAAADAEVARGGT